MTPTELREPSSETATTACWCVAIWSPLKCFCRCFFKNNICRRLHIMLFASMEYMWRGTQCQNTKQQNTTTMSFLCLFSIMRILLMSVVHLCYPCGEFILPFKWRSNSSFQQGQDCKHTEVISPPHIPPPSIKYFGGATKKVLSVIVNCSVCFCILYFPTKSEAFFRLLVLKMSPFYFCKKYTTDTVLVNN